MIKAMINFFTKKLLSRQKGTTAALSHLDRNRNKARHEHLNRSALSLFRSLRLRGRR